MMAMSDKHSLLKYTFLKVTFYHDILAVLSFPNLLLKTAFSVKVILKLN